MRARREPVVDVDGYVRRWVTAAAGEMTCLACGETVPVGLEYCLRCNDDFAPWTRSELTPTVSYLREGEYVVVGRG